MALGFPTDAASGGDILPIVKYDAKAGDFIRQDRMQDASGAWVKDEHEIPQPFKFAMDMDALEVGWLSFESGRPDFRMVKVGQPMIPRPEGEFKNAFRVRVASKELGLREFSHSAKTVIGAMDKLHNQYEAEKTNHPGKLPVVEVTGTSVVKIQTPQGELRFKSPEWIISGWIDRPEIMSGNTAAEPVAPAPAPEVQSADDLF